MSEAIYIESLGENRFIIRVVRANGSVFLINCKRCYVDDRDHLCIEREFIVDRPGERRVTHTSLRVVAKGAWIEWEDVTDRIKIAEAQESMDDGHTRRDPPEHQEPEQLADPPTGVKE